LEFVYLIAGLIIGIASPICVEILVDNNLEDLKISQDMYESPKGLKVIISFIEARISANALEAVSFTVFVFLFGFGVMILLLERIRELKTRIEKLEQQLDDQPYRHSVAPS